MKKKWKANGFIFCLLLLSTIQQLSAQNVEISGQVTDSKNNTTLPGVNVVVKGTDTGTITDLDGTYSLNVPSSKTVLVFSSVGYVTKEITVNGKSNIDVSLKQDISALDEVVLIGYGTQKRKDVTGSVSTVKAEKFEDQPISNPISGLQGRTAGVNIVQGGEPGTSPKIVIRGLSSFNQPNPLYIVDGVRVPNLNSINVKDISSIDVLKDAASAAIYGSAAAGGVVVVTTKKGSGTNGEPVITLNARYGVTNPKLVNLLDKNGFIKERNLTNPEIFQGATQLDTLTNTDWVDELYDMGTEQNYDISISGSSPKLNYLISGFYNAQDGVFLDN